MGAYAFLVGVIAVILSFLFGKKSSKTKISGEVTIEREKGNLAQDVAENVVELAEQNEDIRAEFSKVQDELATAKVQHDPNAAFSVAEKLAEMAQRLL